jgi:hypothetical protein
MIQLKGLKFERASVIFRGCRGEIMTEFGYPLLHFLPFILANLERMKISLSLPGSEFE